MFFRLRLWCGIGFRDSGQVGSLQTDSKHPAHLCNRLHEIPPPLSLSHPLPPTRNETCEAWKSHVHIKDDTGSQLIAKCREDVSWMSWLRVAGSRPASHCMEHVTKNGTSRF